MADIFQEVQEDLRRERFKAFWDRYGTVILVLMGLIVAVVGGWRAYEYYEAKSAAEAGDRYAKASQLAADGKGDEARAAFAAIAAEGPAGYRVIARLREAEELATSDKAGALKLYKAIVDDSGADPMLKDAARVRGAYAAVDGGTRDDVKALAGALASRDGPWETLAREALGLAAYKAGDMADARRQFESVVSDPEAAGSARQRADLMLAVIPAAGAPAAPTSPGAASGDASKPTN